MFRVSEKRQSVKRKEQRDKSKRAAFKTKAAAPGRHPVFRELVCDGWHCDPYDLSHPNWRRSKSHVRNV